MKSGRAGKHNGGDASRAWDWRVGLAENATGDQVLKILRVALAKELAKVWTVTTP